MTKIRKIVSTCLAAAFFVVLLSACFTKDREPMQRFIAVGNRMYLELIPEREYRNVVDGLPEDLAVTSCSGLTKIGEVDDPECYMSRSVYAYPDARYPNLIVARLDWEPSVFKFAYFIENPDSIEDVKNIYGLTSADSIREIGVNSKYSDGGTFTESTITAPTIIASFVDALNDLQINNVEYDIEKERSGEPSYIPTYFFDVTLSNGFSAEFRYYPMLNSISCEGAFYTCNDAILAWIDTNTSKFYRN